MRSRVNSIKFIYILLVLFLSKSTNILASINWIPPIRTYTTNEYNAGTQNWNIVQNSNGWIYTANNSGLLEFNGFNWSLYRIDNRSILRSVAKSNTNNRIYVGGRDEFGYFSPDNIGKLTYTNLSKTLPDSLQQFEEIWKIHITNKKSYFQTRRGFYILEDEDKFTFLKSPEYIISSCNYNNLIYFATSKGIYVVSENSFIQLVDSSSIPTADICDIKPYNNNRLIVATSKNGVYLVDNRQVTTFNTHINKLLKNKQLYSISISERNIAFGTVKDGVIITDINGNNYNILDINRGLENNTILCSMFDNENNLWLGLDNGINKVEVNSQYKNLSSRFEYKFSGYCSSYYNNYIYYGTNQGLIRAKFHNEKIHSNAKIENIINSDGQVWRLEIVNNNLYCCHHRGLFILSNNRLEPVYTNDGVWALSQITDEKYLVGTYSGFKLLNTKTNEINSISGYKISAREFEYQASTNSAWLLTSKGVEKITFSEDFTKAASKLVWESNRFDAHLININNKIILITPEKVFNILNTGELEETDEYNNLIAQKGEECNIKIDKFKNLWYIYPEKLEIRYYDNRFAKYEERRYTLLNNSNYLIEGFTEAKNINNRYAIVNNIYGYSLIDITQKNKINLKKSPIFSQIYTTNHIDSLIYVGSHIAKDTTLTLKQRENSVKFILGVNSSNIGNGKFSYKLDGRDKNWSEWSNNNRVEYHNLFEGNYKLIVRYIDNDGKVTENNIAIKVLPPWYRTILFYIFCTLLFSTLSIYIIWWIKRRYNNAKKRIILEKENEIIRLENEKLESDIKNKSAELSNLLLTRVDKNDIITTVKKELEKLLEDVIKEKGENATKRIMSLNRKLDEKLQDNIDWEYFEENFNLLNDNFVNKLTAYCDSVTINERKLCVYINMGLQNKEIAPLLNISVRGVEMLRYRIRKKLKIERNDSLSEFLNSL